MDISKKLMKNTENTDITTAGVAIAADGGVIPENAGKGLAGDGNGSLTTDNFGW